MRPGIVEDRRLPLALGEQFEHAAHVRPGAAAGQLAVAEGAGSAFAEEVVALRIERAALVEGADVADAVAHRSAALEHERPITLLRQEVRRDQAARPGADDDRPMLQRLASRRRHDERFFVIQFDLGRRMRRAVRTFSDALFVDGNDDLGGVDELKGVLIAGVEGFAQDAKAVDLFGTQAEYARQAGWQDGLGLFDMQTDIGDAERHKNIVSWLVTFVAEVAETSGQ